MTKVKQEKSFAVHWILFKCRESFHGPCFICIEMWQKAIAHKIRRENFRVLSKIHKNHKAFSRLVFIVYIIRDDYKFSEMIGQKPLTATLVPNLIRHPYIVLERQCISGRTLSKMV